MPDPKAGSSGEKMDNDIETQNPVTQSSREHGDALELPGPAKARVMLKRNPLSLNLQGARPTTALSSKLTSNCLL